EGVVQLDGVEARGIELQPARARQIHRIERPAPVLVHPARRADAYATGHRMRVRVVASAVARLLTKHRVHRLAPRKMSALDLVTDASQASDRDRKSTRLNSSH